MGGASLQQQKMDKMARQCVGRNPALDHKIIDRVLKKSHDHGTEFDSIWVESIDDFLARGGEITVCKPRIK